MEKITINQAVVNIQDFCLTQPIMYEDWPSEDQMGVFIRSPKQPLFLTEDLDRLCMDMETSKKEGKMVSQCQKAYINFKVYRTHIKADRKPTSVCYYKIPDGITCTNQFSNGAKDSVILPVVRYEMAIEHSIVDIQVEASVDEDIKDCIEQWAVLNFDDNDMGKEAKAAESEIVARPQEEHGCEDERRTAWVKEAKRWSEDAEFCRIQQEKKQSELLDRDKLKSKGFELAEQSKRNGKNKHSLKTKERGGIDVRVKVGSIFQFDGRERVYSDYVVPSTLAPQEHRIAPCKLQVNLFYNRDIDVYVDGQPAYNCPTVFGKNDCKIICEIGQTLHFQGNGKEYEDYTVPNQDDHHHVVSHLVSEICHQISIAEYPPMPPTPTNSPQFKPPAQRLYLQSPEGAKFLANN
eukprot:jgi/Psemu1/9653/gm1.9653_g